MKTKRNLLVTALSSTLLLSALSIEVHAQTNPDADPSQLVQNNSPETNSQTEIESEGSQENQENQLAPVTEETEDSQETPGNSVQSDRQGDLENPSQADSQNQQTGSQEMTYQIGPDTVKLTSEVGSKYISNDQPNRIVATLTQDPSTSMAFSWYTSENLDEGAVLRVSSSQDMADAQVIPARVRPVTSTYFLRDEDGYIVYGADVDEDGQVDGYFTERQLTFENKDWMGGVAPGYGTATSTSVEEYTYQAEITGLTPGQTYYYTVGSDQNQSPVGQFTTDSRTQPVTFIQYSDTQNAYWVEKVHNQSQYGADTLKRGIDQANKVYGGADFAVHNGDIVEFQWSEDEWYDLMSQSQDSYLRMPHVFAPGNHDGEEFKNHINAPSEGEEIEGTYYSFDYGNIHFTVVNTNENRETTDPANKSSRPMMSPEQIQWLRDDLAATDADWKIVIAHKPLYGAGFNAVQQPDMIMVREELMQILDEYDVDLVLSGHLHSTSITKPLVYSQESDVNARATDDRDLVDGQIVYENPEGTIFAVANVAGPDAIDAVLAYDIPTIEKIAGFLGLTQMFTAEELEDYQSLFTVMDQPASSTSPTLFGNHDSDTSNFILYHVDGGLLTLEVYQIDGNLTKGEERVLTKTHSVTIKKDLASQDPEPSPDRKDEDDSLGQKTPGDDSRPGQGDDELQQQLAGATESKDQKKDQVSKGQADSDGQEKASALPKTGASAGLLSLGISSILAGLGLAPSKRRIRK